MQGLNQNRWGLHFPNPLAFQGRFDKKIVLSIVNQMVPTDNPGA